MRIAVVDDEPIYIDLLKSICNEFEIQRELCLDVFSFSSGKAFLDAFEAGAYQIVFMDILMENMDGIDTARKMREQDKSCFLVFLTSSTDFMPEAFSCHAFDYVVKPFTSQRVFQVISDVQKRLPKSPPPHQNCQRQADGSSPSVRHCICRKRRALSGYLHKDWFTAAQQNDRRAFSAACKK